MPPVSRYEEHVTFHLPSRSDWSVSRTKLSTTFGIVKNSGSFEGAVTETWAAIKVIISIQEGDGDFFFPPTGLLDIIIKGSCFNKP